MIEIKKSKDPKFVDKLCEGVAAFFGYTPRLVNPRMQALERIAAAKLKDNGYRLSRLEVILTWASKHDFWRTRINSVQAICACLLEPKDPTNCLESQFDEWLAAHPPRCSHGYLLSGPCPRCLADPACKNCRGEGQAVEYVTEIYTAQFVCDCAGLKMGLPSLASRIEASRQKRLAHRKPPEGFDEFVTTTS